MKHFKIFQKLVSLEIKKNDSFEMCLLIGRRQTHVFEKLVLRSRDT